MQVHLEKRSCARHGHRDQEGDLPPAAAPLCGVVPLPPWWKARGDPATLSWTETGRPSWPSSRGSREQSRSQNQAKRRLHGSVITTCLILGGVFGKQQIQPSFPLLPALAPGHPEQSGPRLELGLPSFLPYSSHTPIYYFPPGSHRNPCLWAWQEATVLLLGFFNI